MPAGGSKAFTLTAPSTKPTKSSWKVVALSKAGKKTVSGDLDDEQGPYKVVLDDHETGHFATNDATGHLTGTLMPAGGRRQRSAAVDRQQAGELGRPDVDVQNGLLLRQPSVRRQLDGDDQRAGQRPDPRRAGLHRRHPCDLDGELPTGRVDPGQAGVSPMGMTPRSFDLPAGGGTQPLSGSIQDGGDGFFTNGTLTVTPISP